MSKHTNDVIDCPSCLEKLIIAHPDLVKWFKEEVKPKYPDCHVSWSYRDKISQNQAVAEGKSRLAFPLSAHNHQLLDGTPQSLAIDLFKIASNGMACWEYKYFKDIATMASYSATPIKWGGAWAHLGDFDHYELQKPKAVIVS